MDRQKVSLFILGGLMAALFAWWFLGVRGLITIEVEDAPLASILESIRKQSGTKVITNLPADQKVTLRVRRVPLPQAMDELAGRTDSQWRFSWLIAPAKSDISSALAQIPQGRVEGWSEFDGGRGMGITAEFSPDPRRFDWRPEQPEEGTLHSLLDQAAQKTGLLFAAPDSWDPVIPKLPPSGLVSKSILSLAGSLKGQAESTILLTSYRRETRPRGAAGEAAERSPENMVRSGRVFVSNSPRPRSPVNQAWAEERLEQQIKGLPEEEAAELKQDLDEMRKFWQEIRGLPAEERRARIEEMMSRPDIQERMEERISARMSRRSPEQRRQRYSRYIERKKRIKEQGSATR